jgi:hypothetical protein
MTVQNKGAELNDPRYRIFKPLKTRNAIHLRLKAFLA